MRERPPPNDCLENSETFQCSSSDFEFVLTKKPKAMKAYEDRRDPIHESIRFICLFCFDIYYTHKIFCENYFKEWPCQDRALLNTRI